MPNNIVCPRQLYGHDLKMLIDEKMRMGHQILICGDFNSRYADLKMLDASRKYLLATEYGIDPRTYKRSKNYPINCCFGSPCFNLNKGGYLLSRRLQRNHKGVCMDTPVRQLLGHNHHLSHIFKRGD